MDIRVLVFNSGTFNRAELSKMSEQELWQLWEKDDDQAQVQMYYLDEFSCAFNDEEVSDQDWLYFVDYDNIKQDAGDGYSDTMQDKLSWLLQSHYNTFHADMIQRAMNDDSISAEDFIKGCVAIHTSERDTDDDEFTPAEFENVSESVVGRKVAFQYNGKRYEREVTEVCDIILGTWVGDLGFEQEGNDHSDSFLIHGDTTDKRVPLMQGLVVQYDSEDGSRHGYVREVEVLEAL